MPDEQDDAAENATKRKGAEKATSRCLMEQDDATENATKRKGAEKATSRCLMEQDDAAENATKRKGAEKATSRCLMEQDDATENATKRKGAEKATSRCLMEQDDAAENATKRKGAEKATSRCLMEQDDAAENATKRKGAEKATSRCLMEQDDAAENATKRKGAEKATSRCLMEQEDAAENATKRKGAEKATSRCLMEQEDAAENATKRKGAEKATSRCLMEQEDAAENATKRKGAEKATSRCLMEQDDAAENATKRKGAEKATSRCLMEQEDAAENATKRKGAEKATSRCLMEQDDAEENATKRKGAEKATSRCLMEQDDAAENATKRKGAEKATSRCLMEQDDAAENATKRKGAEKATSRCLMEQDDAAENATKRKGAEKATSRCLMEQDDAAENATKRKGAEKATSRCLMEQEDAAENATKRKGAEKATSRCLMEQEDAAENATKRKGAEKATSRCLMECLEEAGKEIFTNKVLYSLTDDLQGPRPIMLPPCPISQFIDRFPSKTHTKAEATAAKQQAQYEGEVEVFHALERLEQPLFIMHSFKYTHQQYALFVDHECKRKETEEEGEADFVAVQDDLIAIYEVKAVEFTKENAKTVFIRNYKKALEQLEKSCNLIKKICRKTGSSEPKICKFTVFTNLERKSAENILRYSSLSNFEKSEILFKDELVFKEGSIWIGKCFNRKIDDHKRDYWDHNIINPSYIEKKSLCVLLGLWCGDEKNRFSKDKWDSGRNINHIDNLLRNAYISNKPAGPKSSKVKGSPPELKELGILCLTEEQKKVFYSKNQRIMINGPAGSGKTLLILGKIVQLARKSGGLIIVIVPSTLMADWYETNLKKVGISSVRELRSNTKIDKYQVYVQKIEDFHFNRMGFVNEWAKTRLKKLYETFEVNAHIFIDDFHAFDFAFSYYPYGLDSALKEGCNNLWEYTLLQLKKSSKKTFWICYDSLQASFYGSFEQQQGRIETFESNHTVLKLSANLRNSFETAKFIWFLRNKRLENIGDCIGLCKSVLNSKDRYKPFDVEQDIGHYIHGPTPRLHWIDLYGRRDKSEYLVNFLTNEIANILSCEKVALIHDDYGDPVDLLRELCEFLPEPAEHYKKRLKQLSAIDPLRLDEICEKAKETIHTEFKDCRMDLQVIHMDRVGSAEWPAIIGMIKLNEKCNIALDLEHKEEMHNFHKFINNPMKHEVHAKQDSFDRLLAKMNAIVTRGRVFSALICVIDENEPFFGNEIEGCHYTDEYIDAAMLKCYGNNVLNKVLYGELGASSTMSACDTIDLTKEQIQSMIDCISLFKVPIRLPDGKMVKPKVIAEKVALSYGLEINWEKTRQSEKGTINATHEQQAIYFRNRRKICLKPSIIQLIGCWVHPFSISNWTTHTSHEMRSQWFLKFLERIGFLWADCNEISAEDRNTIIESYFFVEKALSCNEEDKNQLQMTKESLLKERKTDWKRFRTMSLAEKVRNWRGTFIGKRYSA